MSVTPIHVFAKWKIRPGQLENVLLILKELKAKSIQEKGNLFYQVHQDNSDPNTLILFEGYSDDSALTLHRNAGYYIYTSRRRRHPHASGGQGGDFNHTGRDLMF